MRIILLIFLSLLVPLTGSAIINLTFTYDEGTNTTTASYSGTWDVSANTGGFVISSVFDSTNFRRGDSIFAGIYNETSGIASPYPWGTATPTDATGDVFGFNDFNVVGPQNFTDSTPIVGSLIFAEMTLEELGLTPGTSGTLSGDAGTVEWSAVPEPAAYAALFAVGVLGIACWRRRKTKV